MLQVDGSPFDWLQDRGPKGTLIGAIDDATGKVLFLTLRPTEDQAGYLLLLRAIAQAAWPAHGHLPRPAHHPALAQGADHRGGVGGRAPMSQIQRVMDDLGIESIPAYSPQAKGRIKRLWGTLQDRLTKELRLAGVSTLPGGQSLPARLHSSLSSRFARAPQDPNSAWVPLPADIDTSYYFAIRHSRRVRADHCISYSSRTLQLLP